MPMPIKLVGGGVVQPGVEAVIDPTFFASRYSPRPLDYANLGQNLGHYAVVGTTAAIAPAANAALFAFRWTDPSRFALIQSVVASVQVVTAVTAQRVDAMLMTVARAYTVRDLTNATVVAISGSNQKMASKMGSSIVGNIDVASAAAGLTGGTKTLDANPIGLAGLSGSTAITGIGTGVLNTIMFDPNTGDGEHPLLLAQNEGFQIIWGATALATGTLTVSVKVRWVEVSTF